MGRGEKTGRFTQFCTFKATPRRYNAPMIDRRQILTLGASALVGFSPRVGQAAPMSHITAYAFSFKGLDGDEIRLADYVGRPMLVINTASLCGYTPQYAGLQELWTRYRAKGLFVLGVPSNDFGGQEPGGAAEIVKTAQGEFHVTFPLAEKVTVKGKDAHPFYRWAARERPLEAPRWNFHKYLVGRDGQLVAGFTSAVEPTDPLIVTAIKKELTPE
jgi:glutathione peroxidase